MRPVDHPGIALALELAERGRALPVDAARAGELQQDDDHEKQPERRAREIREVLRPKTRGSFHRLPPEIPGKPTPSRRVCRNGAEINSYNRGVGFAGPGSTGAAARAFLQA